MWVPQNIHSHSPTPYRKDWNLGGSEIEAVRKDHFHRGSLAILWNYIIEAITKQTSLNIHKILHLLTAQGIRPL